MSSLHNLANEYSAVQLASNKKEKKAEKKAGIKNGLYINA